MFRAFFTGFALLLACAAPALANDSQAETALGGLVLKQSDAISMDSEDLYLSRERVRVAYRFTNMSDAPVDTLVAFPLPDIPPEDGGDNIAWWTGQADLKFRTSVDGQLVPLDIVEQAIFNGKDVTERLRSLKIPLNRMDEHIEDALKKLTRAERQKLVADGLLRDDSADDYFSFSPRWSLRTTVTRRQVFPAKSSVTVEHEYKPLTGGSVGGGLSREARKTDWFRSKRDRYCIEPDFISAFDRRLGKNGKDWDYTEVWLAYVLKTGANWKGPIRDFRLVVDKDKTDSLLSFCAEGVKKISPTQFEVRRKDFEPKKDLDILFVEWNRR